MKKSAKAIKRTYLIISKSGISLPEQKQIKAELEKRGIENSANAEFFVLNKANSAEKKTFLDLLKLKNNGIVFCPYGKFEKKFIENAVPQFISAIREERLDLDFHYSPIFLK